MIDPYTIELCKQDKKILQKKISNLEYAIKESEKIIFESQMDDSSSLFLRRKIADSIQDLEALYLIKNEHKINES